MKSVLAICYELACGEYFDPCKIAEKVLQSGFYWPTLFKFAFDFCKTCTRCQMIGRISKRNMMPLNTILEVELFDIWGIDFMGPLPNSFGNQYILLLWITYPNGLKSSLARQMTKKLLSSS